MYCKNVGYHCKMNKMSGNLIQGSALLYCFCNSRKWQMTSTQRRAPMPEAMRSRNSPTTRSRSRNHSRKFWTLTRRTKVCASTRSHSDLRLPTPKTWKSVSTAGELHGVSRTECMLASWGFCRTSDENVLSWTTRVATVACVFTVPNDPRHVIVQKLAIISEGHPDIEVDLTGQWSTFWVHEIVLCVLYNRWCLNVVIVFSIDLKHVNDLCCLGDISQLKKKSVVMKEGVKYRVRIYFYVQREIVSGLKYMQKIHRAGLQGTSRIMCLLYTHTSRITCLMYTHTLRT